MIHRLHTEIPCHEFNDGAQTIHGRTHRQTGKTMLRNRRIDHTGRAELIEQTLGDFISPLIFGDFLTHQVHIFITAHFLGHRIAERITHRLRFGFGERGLVEWRRLQNLPLRIKDVTVFNHRARMLGRAACINRRGCIGL